MKKMNVKSSLMMIVVTVMLAACSGLNKQQKGVLIGAGAGGAVGAGVGKAAGNTALGAIIGATVGGVTGGIIGKKMDKQAEEMAKIPGAEVKRVGEGINITFESGVLFAINQSTLNSASQANIRELAEVLNKYPDTYVLIEGHTDNTGSAQLNLSLSERRAKSVAEYLKEQNIAANRLKTAWYGLAQPKYPNDSETNRAKNRRVEFAIYANEKMIEDAKKETGS